MASIVEEYSPATLRFDAGKGYGTESYSRSKLVGLKMVPDKVSGSWITFPDGSRFRRSTDYANYQSSTVDGPSQDTRAKITSPDFWSGNNPFFETSAGGYQSDDVYKYNQFDALRSIGVGNTRTGLGSIPQNRRNRAVTEALNEIADEKAQIGENLATFLQTVRLIRNPLELLVKGIRTVHANRSLRPFIYQSARDLIRAGPLNVAAQEYLKYVYGWKPLMQDIHGIIELSKTSSARPLLLHARSSHTEATQVSNTYDNFSDRSVMTLGPLNTVDRVNCDLWARIDPDHATIRALNQLGLVNPLALAWELVPWSFVVDWVLPIGSTLKALTAPAGLRFVDGSLSWRVNAKGPYSIVIDAFERSYFPTYEVKSSRPAGGSFLYDAYRREVIRDWPLPGFYVDYDPFRGDRPLKALALSVVSLKSIR